MSPAGVRHAVQRLARSTELLIEEMPYFRKKSLDVEFRRMAVSLQFLRDAAPAPLDFPDSKAGKVAQALSDGREQAIDCATKLERAWRMEMNVSAPAVSGPSPGAEDSLDDARDGLFPDPW